MNSEMFVAFALFRSLSNRHICQSVDLTCVAHVCKHSYAYAYTHAETETEASAFSITPSTYCLETGSFAEPKPCHLGLLASQSGDLYFSHQCWD